MKNTNTKYAKIMLAAALAFSFAAEATDYTYSNTVTNTTSTQGEQSFKQFEKEVLGPYAKTNSLTGSNIGHAYLTFMENVRVKHTSWGKQEWNHANTIMNKLNARTNSLGKFLKVADKSNISEMQREFKALESESDTRNN